MTVDTGNIIMPDRGTKCSFGENENSTLATVSNFELFEQSNYNRKLHDNHDCKHQLMKPYIQYGGSIVGGAKISSIVGTRQLFKALIGYEDKVDSTEIFYINMDENGIKQLNKTIVYPSSTINNEELFAYNNALIISESKKLVSLINESCKSQNTRLATKYIFDCFSAHLEQNDIIRVASILKLIDFKIFPSKVLIAFLSITNPWKDKAAIRKHRLDILALTEIALKSDGLNKRRIQSILSGLR